jgi:mono/diheme cytochrome c family protein
MNAAKRWRAAALAVLACSTGVSAQDAGSVQRGQAKFEHSCAPCHGAGVGDDGRAMLPGTDALRIKYQGSLPALLEQRTDLNVEAIRTFVRRGTWSMPPFRPTEVTERDIQDIAAYLRQSSSAASRRAR